MAVKGGARAREEYSILYGLAGTISCFFKNFSVATAFFIRVHTGPYLNQNYGVVIAP